MYMYMHTHIDTISCHTCYGRGVGLETRHSGVALVRGPNHNTPTLSIAAVTIATATPIVVLLSVLTPIHCSTTIAWWGKGEREEGSKGRRERDEGKGRETKGR